MLHIQGQEIYEYKRIEYQYQAFSASAAAPAFFSLLS